MRFHLLLALLAASGTLVLSSAPAVSASDALPLAKKVCGKKQKAKRGGKRKGKGKRRACKPDAPEEQPVGYHPRAWLFWRTSADVDLHVFDAFQHHSSPANLLGIEGTAHGPDGSAGIGIDTGPNEFFMEQIPMTARTFYVYACLDSAAAQPTTVEAEISDSESSTRRTPQFVLSTEGQEVAVGRIPAWAPDPSFPIPVLCP